jgi:hypothetical protein
MRLAQYLLAIYRTHARRGSRVVPFLLTLRIFCYLHEHLRTFLCHVVNLYIC